MTSRGFAVAIVLLLGGAGYLAFLSSGLPHHHAPAVAGATSTGGSSNIPKGDPNDAVLVALGQRVYAEQCAICHGANLEGQPNWRARLADGTLPAPPHDPSGHTWHHDDKLLFNYTKYGGQALIGSNGKSAMPGFALMLSDREIWASIAFIKSTWPADTQRMQARQNAAVR